MADAGSLLALEGPRLPLVERKLSLGDRQTTSGF